MGENRGSLGVGDANEANLLNNLTAPGFLTQAVHSIRECLRLTRGFVLQSGDGVNMGVYAYDREGQKYYSIGTSSQGNEDLPLKF